MFSGHQDEPVLVTGFTSDEIEELMASLVQPVGSPNSGSDEWSNWGPDTNDERKRKRKLSNRESARRSRLRKKVHLEDLAAQADRLANQNRELKNRVGLVVNQSHLIRRQNEELRSESMSLWARLSDLHRIFEVMQHLALATGQVSLITN